MQESARLAELIDSTDRLVCSIVENGNVALAIEIARDLNDPDWIAALQEVVMTFGSDDGEDAIEFARTVKRTDMSAMEEAVVDHLSVAASYRFLFEACPAYGASFDPSRAVGHVVDEFVFRTLDEGRPAGMDLRMVERLVLTYGWPNSALILATEAPASEYCHSLDFKGLEDVILKGADASCAIEFAHLVQTADIPALQAMVEADGAVIDLIRFGELVDKANAGAIEKVVRREGRPEDIVRFCSRHRCHDIDGLLEQLASFGNLDAGMRAINFSIDRQSLNPAPVAELVVAQKNTEKALSICLHPRFSVVPKSTQCDVLSLALDEPLPTKQREALQNRLDAAGIEMGQESLLAVEPGKAPASSGGQPGL